MARIRRTAIDGSVKWSKTVRSRGGDWSNSIVQGQPVGGKKMPRSSVVGTEGRSAKGLQRGAERCKSRGGCGCCHIHGAGQMQSRDHTGTSSSRLGEGSLSGESLEAKPPGPGEGGSTRQKRTGAPKVPRRLGCRLSPWSGLVGG